MRYFVGERERIWRECDRGFSGSEQGMVLSLVITQETFSLNELGNCIFLLFGNC